MDHLRDVVMWILLEVAVLLVAIALFMGSLEVGYRLGLRRQVKSDEPDRTHANALHGAVLGLLALLLGFTFAMAVSRYEKSQDIDRRPGQRHRHRGSCAAPCCAAARRRTVTLFRDYVETRFLYNASLRGSNGVIEAESRAVRDRE
jgi:hypothetical protein